MGTFFKTECSLQFSCWCCQACNSKDKDKISDETAAVVDDIQLVVEEGGSAGIYEQSNDQNEISDKVTAASSEILSLSFACS